MTIPVTTTCGGLLGLYAQTSLHPGAGTALGTVDLPVQRERHTLWPNIAGSAIKGILRDACRENLIREKNLQDEPVDPNDPKKHRRSKRDLANKEQDLVDVFGPPSGSASEAAGALSVTDARLLAFPVRSLKGVFAWVSCPAVLDRLQRDAELVNLSLWQSGAIPQAAENQAVVSSARCDCLIGTTELVLEEFQFTKDATSDANEIAAWISTNLLPEAKANGKDTAYAKTVARFPKHFVILNDNDFTHFARHATEITARIALDYDTKTVSGTALFYQEFLPAETLLYSVVLANAARVRFGTKNEAMIRSTLAKYLPRILQIGGDETTGKGYCVTRFVPKEAAQRTSAQSQGGAA